MKTYSQKLTERIESVNSNLCVGLDPRMDQIDGDFEAFVLNLIDETISSAACYKPNAAYFEALGSKGYAIMEGSLLIYQRKYLSFLMRNVEILEPLNPIMPKRILK